MRVDEKTLASERQEKKTTLTASLLESAEAQAEQETELVQAARDFLEQEQFAADRFPLTLDLFWKLEAGQEVKAEEEDGPWFMFANWALREQAIPVEARKRVARELCQASLDSLKTEEGMADMQAVVAEAKKEKEPPQPWAYTKGELIMSLVGNEPFTVEMIEEINKVCLKVKEKGETKEEDQKGEVCAKVKSYQISAPLHAYQEEMGLEREVVMVVQVADDHEEKFFKAIKKKCKGFKCEILEKFRSPCTQNKPEMEDLGEEKEVETVESAADEREDFLVQRLKELEDKHEDDLSATDRQDIRDYSQELEALKVNKKSEGADMDSEPELPEYLLDVGTTLLADAVASETENDDSEFHDLMELFVRSQEDIVDNVKSEAENYGLDLQHYVDKAMVRDVERRVDEQWAGAVTLKDLYDYNEHAAHGLLLQAVGHGVSHLDEPEIEDWLKGKGVDPDVELPYYESPYDGAYSFLSDLRLAMGGDDEPKSEEPVEDGTKIKVKFSNIEWDTEGEEVDLPEEVELEVPPDVDLDSVGADLLSDKFGWAVRGFKFEKLP